MAAESNSGYSTRTLAQKLGYKTGQRVCLINLPDHYFDILGALPADVEIVEELSDKFDLIHYFCTENDILETEFAALKAGMQKNGSLWVSWPKKTSPLASNISGDSVRKTALDGGLVDVKVCAVDADWSGLKLMYRRKDR